MKKLLLAALLLLTALPIVAQAQVNSWTNTFSINIFNGPDPILSTNSLSITLLTGETANSSVTLSNAGNVAVSAYISNDSVDAVFHGYDIYWENNANDWVPIYDANSSPQFSSWQILNDIPLSSVSTPIGFNFPFHYDGNIYKFFSAGINGGVTLGSLEAFALPEKSNNSDFFFYQSIYMLSQPSTAYGHRLYSTEPLLAPLWGVYSVNTNKVLYSSQTNRLVVAWNGVAQANGESGLSFQVQMYPDGSMTYVYQSVTDSAFTNAAKGFQKKISNSLLVANTVSVVSDTSTFPFIKADEPPEEFNATSGYTLYMDANVKPWITSTTVPSPIIGTATETVQFEINADGKSAGTYDEAVQVIWNDGTTNTIDLTVTVSAATTTISVPTDVAFQGIEGDRATTNIFFANTGDTELNYTIFDSTEAAASSATSWERTTYDWLDVHSMDNAVEVTLTKPGENVFDSYENISVSELLPIGFDFSYFGDIYTNLCIGKNGGISLGKKHSMVLSSHWFRFNLNRTSNFWNLDDLDSTKSGTQAYLEIFHTLSTASARPAPLSNRLYYSKLATRDAPVPSQFLAPYWADMSTDSDSKIYIGYDDQRTIITWENMRQNGESQTFQAILYKSRQIVYQYANLRGIENWVHTTTGLRDTSDRSIRGSLSGQEFTSSFDIGTEPWDLTWEGLPGVMDTPGTNTTVEITYHVITTNGYMMIGDFELDIPILVTNVLTETLYRNTVTEQALIFDPTSGGSMVYADQYTGSIAPGESNVVTIIGDARNRNAGATESRRYTVISEAGNRTMDVDFTVIAMPAPDQLLDSDKDGLADTLERQLGSDPFDSNSTYKTHVDGSRAITWTAASDGDSRTYLVQYRTSLTSGKWIYLPDQLQPKPNETACRDTLNTDEPMVFYRVLLTEWKD